MKRMHDKTELEAEELAKEEDKKKTNEHAAADEQEEGEVEHPDNAAVGDQEDGEVHHHEPVEYEEPAAQQEVRQNMDLKQILTSVGLEEYYEQFETELITIETLKTTTALELREILKIPFGSAKLIVNEVKDQLVKGQEAAPTSDQTTTLQRGVCPTASNVETFSC